MFIKNGSGNNGLTAILPIVAYKNKFHVEEERLAKALAISHLINSYIKHHIGRLSALCGAATAEDTIKNLGTLSIEGMTITDNVILKVMQNMEPVL